MKQDETRRMLIDGTIHVIARDGLDKATTKQIGLETSINEAYIYRCFAGKEDMFAKTFDRLAAEGKEKQIIALHYGLWAVNWFLYSLFAFFGILFGSDAVSALLDAIPDVVMNGLTVCGGLLPAVGMAMLMKMLWDNKICMFYFLGFVLAAYLNLPLIALAVIGVIIAISIGMNDYKLNQLAAQRVAVSPAGSADEYLDEEEEEFFS